MAKIRISKITVDAIAPPDRGEATIWDDRIAGFGVKVTSSGSKIYIYRYRISRPGLASQTPPRKYTIGRHGNLTPEQARKRAQELAALVSQGIDPRRSEIEALEARTQQERIAEERNRALRDLAFGRISGLWLENYENDQARRKSSVDMAKLVVRRYLRPELAAMPMPDIRRAHLQPIFDGIPTIKRGMRRAVFTYASILWGWCIRRGYVEENPLAAMEKPPAPAARERVLSDAEIVSVWQASENAPLVWSVFFQLLILTGQRRSEVSGMKWEELDREAALWTIPAERAKNGKAHLVPLSPASLALLDRLANGPHWPRRGFAITTTMKSAVSGISKAKKVLDKAIGEARGCKDSPLPIDAWRIHDLRRTMATGLQRLGVRFEVTEAILNHTSGAKGGVAGIYQLHDWAEEKKAALQAWSDHLESLFKNATKACCGAQEPQA